MPIFHYFSQKTVIFVCNKKLPDLTVYFPFIGQHLGVNQCLGVALICSSTPFLMHFSYIFVFFYNLFSLFWWETMLRCQNTQQKQLYIFLCKFIASVTNYYNSKLRKIQLTFVYCHLFWSKCCCIKSFCITLDFLESCSVFIWWWQIT